LLAEAQKYGARVALFGRKINNAENQFVFIRFLRLITDGLITPEEAVRAYHAALAKLGVHPHRSLEDDMQLQTGVMSYGGSTTTVSVPGTSRDAGARNGTAACPCECVNSGSHPSPDAGSSAEASSAAESARRTFLPRRPEAEPDFSKMTSAQKLAYHRTERDRVFG